MNAIESADEVGKLPATGAARDRRLVRLTDLCAANEAAEALQAAAHRAREGAGVLPDALQAALTIFAGGLEDRGRWIEDAAARERLRETVATPEFLSLLPAWIRELRETASTRPGTGACTVASALEVWLWTMDHFGTRPELGPQVVDELADALCGLLAARSLALEIAGTASSSPSEIEFRTDLSHVQAARAAASAGAACAELVFGYRKHLVWDAEGCHACYAGEELDGLEALIPGIASGGRMGFDVVESDGSHPAKAGPCARFDGLDSFVRLRRKLDGCLTGARFARDRAAAALVRSMGAGEPAAAAGRG